jgi:hypothetical protein
MSERTSVDRRRAVTRDARALLLRPRQCAVAAI